MLELNWKPMRSYLAASLLALGAGTALLPANPAWAQGRTLPDFN